MGPEMFVPLLIGVALVMCLLILATQGLAAWRRKNRRPKITVQKRTMPDHSKDG